ncbi:hypothetical protein F4827_002551 [Paraburkholderia bannensis]|uniref:Transposase n=1 Tax=Paraburkholderia bannensis TaxID=765414 RepID=A0A7W9TX35_9BURK|nr:MULTISPECIES: hypothetical protein [Paraburkholderia]MBB3257686.1 hypothetical protein [Paraburkholderia sp. WP4_3_2]MBB6102699.1 hypothetical protein [Paraburkholderia bannensis]
MSRWTTTEVALLAHVVPAAQRPEDLRPLFPRHPLGGVRWKALRCGLKWPTRRRARKA